MVILNHDRMPLEISLCAVLHLGLRDADHVAVVIMESILAPERNPADLSVICDIFVVFIKPIRVFIMPIRLQ